MKKALLIMLMLLLPWQAFAAAERNFAHLLGSESGSGAVFSIQHMADHADRIPHHHDTDVDVDDDDDQADDDHDGVAGGKIHVDQSQKSLRHLADFDHSCSIHILLPAVSGQVLPSPERIAPLLMADAFPDRSTTPLLRPPRAFA